MTNLIAIDLNPLSHLDMGGIQIVFDISKDHLIGIFHDGYFDFFYLLQHLHDCFQGAYAYLIHESF